MSPTPQTSTWWAEARQDNMDILLEIVSGELEDRDVPPIAAMELAEDLISTALLIGAHPHEIKIWLAERPARTLSAANFRNWCQWFRLQKPAAAGGAA